MSIKLIVSWKDEANKPQLIERCYDKNAVSIGRNIKNDFCIPDRFVSNYHARIEFDGKKYQLYDLGSSNGVYLNGKKLDPNEQKTIQNDDKIKISDFEIKLISEKPCKVSAATTTSASLQQAAYESLLDILNHFVADNASFQNEQDIQDFCKSIKETLDTFFKEFSTNLQMHTNLQYELDLQTINEGSSEYNPLKLTRSPKDVARYLLDWKNDDIRTTIEFLKKTCAEISSSQKTVFKTLENVLPALLDKLSPTEIQMKIQSSETHKMFLDKVTRQNYKRLWDEYVETHTELKENKNKRFEIIKSQFQKIYPNIE